MAKIPRNVIDEIRNSVDIGDVIGATTNGGAQAGQLPQTGNQSEAALAAMGVAGMLAALGFTKTGKKREA